MFINIISHFQILFVIPFIIVIQDLIAVFINIVIFETPVGKTITQPDFTTIGFTVFGIFFGITGIFIAVTCIEIYPAVKSISGG
ncbi:hypothetical protein D3C80_1965150 [compost metagenome]